MDSGFLCIVLHAHLPYVRHPEYEDFLEERWFFEAITECYIPLLRMAENLDRDGVPFRLTISLSPPLLGMLSDPLLQSRYRRHLLKLIELAEKEILRTKGSSCGPLSEMYHRNFSESLATWDFYNSNLLEGFARFVRMGYFEIITSSATHAFLPAFRRYSEAIGAQVRIGFDYYRSLFGQYPPGMWLPECGYFPELEKILHQEGVKYFFVEQHGIKYATPLPLHGIYAPIYTPEGIAVFGRDPLTSEQVWSSEMGYPGDPNYREYYRDIGYDLDFDYIRPYIHVDGIRINTGIKYHRITGKTNKKDFYNPLWAAQTLVAHGWDFLEKNAQRIQRIAPQMENPPLVTAPYDAELFGHWWHEGPLWLEEVFRQRALYFPQIIPVTPSQYLDRYPTHQMALPATSSWGKKGYSEVWIGDQNSWIYHHLLIATEKMSLLCVKYPQAQGLRKRALNQALRELLLAQSSDWPFLIHTGTATKYAKKRVEFHLSRFLKIVRDIDENTFDESWLEGVEYLDNIFPSLDYRSFLQGDLPRESVQV